MYVPSENKAKSLEVGEDVGPFAPSTLMAASGSRPFVLALMHVYVLFEHVACPSRCCDPQWSRESEVEEELKELFACGGRPGQAREFV